MRGNRKLGEGLVVTEEGDIDSREVMDGGLASYERRMSSLVDPVLAALISG